MDLLQVLNASILQVIFILFWTPIRVNCNLWITYKRVYSDKLCSANFGDHGFVAKSLLRCLASCSHTADCGALIYNRQNTHCYRLRSITHHDDCSTALIESRQYQKESCPLGWDVVARSCYKIIEEAQNQSSSAAICDSFGGNAHLADLKTWSKDKQVREWFSTKHIGFAWIGLTYDNGWKWSDGTKDRGFRQSHVRCTGITESYSMSTYHLYAVGCHYKYRGLCEIDIKDF